MNVRCRTAEVLRVCIDLEPVTFNRGFFACDLSFFFLVSLDIFTAPHSQPCEVKGITVFQKKVILYGSEGSVKTFSSEFCCEDTDEPCQSGNNLPKCVVQVVDPVVLSAQVCDTQRCCDPCCCVPNCVTARLGGEICPDRDKGRSVYVTLGVFSIIQMVRNVALLIPVYDFCVPRKECETTTDCPCDAFKRIKFPTDEFFPPKDCECGQDDTYTCCPC